MNDHAYHHAQMTVTSRAYQATDLARNHRAVIDDARRGRALIRDKDGLQLVMTPADLFERNEEVSALALDLVRAARALLNGEGSSAADFGSLAWAWILPEDAQRRFFAEMSDALFVAASGLDLRQVELLIGDWRATAESWADPETREQLEAGAPAPLDVTL